MTYEDGLTHGYSCGRKNGTPLGQDQLPHGPGSSSVTEQTLSGHCYRDNYRDEGTRR